MAELRHLVLVLGDQLDLDAAAFDGFDAAHDAVWMAELAEESTHVWSSKPRTVMFLAAMRHFAQALRAAGRPLHHTRLDDPANHGSLQAQLHADIERLRPTGLVMTAPGDWRVLQAIKCVARAHGLPLDIREDRHFYGSVREFAAHARGRKSLRMEYFYREMRKRHGVLMQGAGGDQPEGGQWNFDEDNREAFGASGPGTVPPRAVFLGWREYVRGIYWTRMPGYAELNALDAREDLPAWYWTGATEMACLRDAIGQTLQHGYAHHIQRLMVTGLFALMYGVQPRQVHAWYLAVYVDAVEWVELPNTLGMSQYADGGLMASKPYVATGKYIQRMSPHCKGCRYDPAQRTGDTACPFTTLYWDFLMRHEAALAGNPRMALQVKNVARLSDEQKQAIRERAAAVRSGEVA